MYIQNPQPSQPILAISSKTLDFGLVSADTPTEGHGVAKLTITNDGDRILVGRIAIQVAWVSVFPPDFRVNPGESSEHAFTVRHNAQMAWTTHRLGSEFIALINSNGGSETIGGFYYSDTTRKEKKKQPIRSWLYALIPLLIALAAVMIFLIFREDKTVQTVKRTENSDVLYTQIAETYFAKLTESPNATETPPAEAAEATVDPLIVAGPTVADQPAMTITNTPWVAADFPNVEDFIRSYYATLQKGEYDTAWYMLTEKMQRACCQSGEGTPLEVYKAYWQKVDWVDVSYAFLQAYDTNPAEVNAGLLYHFKDGTTEETVSRFSIITDPVRNQLVIDEIR